MGYQIWSVLENTTTIEALEKQRLQRWLEKYNKEDEIEFPYNTTITSNLHLVFGNPNPILWLWPWTQTSHDGLDFPVVEDAELPWPPPDSLPSTELAPPTAELPWSNVYKHEAVTRLRRRRLADEESGESELSDDDEDEDRGDLFDGWFGMEELEDYGVDVDSEIRGLTKEEEGVVWQEVLRKRREGD